ncbi:hypothetical protein ACVWW2_003010 [Bradyrhizobium sp. LM4.3]
MVELRSGPEDLTIGSIKKAFDLTGRNALVTGGSRGLGLQIAEALGEQGARIVISSRKAPDLEKAQAHLAGLGIKAEWIAADNSRDEDVKRLADETIKKLGRVDILVNNAGATWGAPTEDHPIEAWDKVMNLNIRSLFLLSQQIAKGSMIPNKYGRIVNLAFDRGPVRKFRGYADGRLQHKQRRCRQLHAGVGGELGALRNYGQCSGAWLFPIEGDKGNDRSGRGRKARRWRAAAPHR